MTRSQLVRHHAQVRGLQGSAALFRFLTEADVVVSRQAVHTWWTDQSQPRDAHWSRLIHLLGVSDLEIVAAAKHEGSNP